VPDASESALHALVTTGSPDCARRWWATEQSAWRRLNALHRRQILTHDCARRGGKATECRLRLRSRCEDDADPVDLELHQVISRIVSVILWADIERTKHGMREMYAVSREFPTSLVRIPIAHCVLTGPGKRITPATIDES
jgi:hypothetical protein